ncbi:MAG TPA: PIN domain-containing protein [Planctomycetota bacterium]|jgi:hypothetical protein
MRAVFLDTSFALALELADDSAHNNAAECWAGIVSERDPLVTTSGVVMEVAAYLANRRLHGQAVRVAKSLMNHPQIECVFVDEILFDLGWSYFQRHSDKTYSLVDCISFTLMKQRKMTTALTFDKHFAQAGFNMVPEQ